MHGSGGSPGTHPGQCHRTLDREVDLPELVRVEARGDAVQWLLGSAVGFGVAISKEGSVSAALYGSGVVGAAGGRDEILARDLAPTAMGQSTMTRRPNLKQIWTLPALIVKQTKLLWIPMARFASGR